MAEWHDASLLDLVVLPMIPYLVWALLYYVKVAPLPSLPVQCCCHVLCTSAQLLDIVAQSCSSTLLNEKDAMTSFTQALQHDCLNGYTPE